MFYLVAGNAKQPNILGQMIAEAREIRETQSCRNNAASSAAAGAKLNHADDSVSKLPPCVYILPQTFRKKINKCINIKGKPGKVK